MSTFSGWSSALIAAGTSMSTMQSTFASLLSTTGANPWQITHQAVIGTVWSTGGTPATTPGSAMDMNSTTSATGNLPAYVGIYYASGFTPKYMYIQADISATPPPGAPITFTLDYSSNGSSWTTLQSFSSQTGWTSCERRKYTIAGATSQNYWRINITAVMSGSTLGLGEWVLEDNSGNWLTTVNFFDCIPPATETIGNSIARDELRWTFPSAGTSITLTPVQTLLTALPQLYSWDTAITGAVTLSITINSNTVSYVGVGGNTAIQNARGLYEACKQSVNANFTAWNWYWNSVLGNTVGGGYFFASQVTPALNQTFTSSNITTRVRGTSIFSVPMVQGSQIANTTSFTIDLINGWIYYLQLCTRGLAIASKTNSNYFGPIHACYGDSAASLAQIPISEFATTLNIPCTPIELFVGTNQIVTNSGGLVYPSHWWGMGNAWSNFNVGLPLQVDYNNYNTSHPFTHQQIPGILHDWSQSGVAFSGNAVGGYTYGVACAEGLLWGTTIPTVYNVHRMSILPWQAGGQYINASVGNTTYLFISNPIYSNIDWYKYSGTAPSNEQLVIAPLTDYTTNITTSGLSTDVTINVTSTTGFPTSGWVVIDGEIINYGGTTTNTFTSCVRGKFATPAIAPISGAVVYIAGWFAFINSGLVFGGYQQPT